MNYEKSEDGKTLRVVLAGEVDSLNAAEIEGTLLKLLDGVTELIFDLTGLEYISSAGLRMMLGIQKTMQSQGNMCLTNTNEEVMEIFKVTGFSRLLNIV